MFIVLVSLSWFFFFFKQKTAYEMRISDWSSDVCSSDLLYRAGDAADVGNGIALGIARIGADAGDRLDDDAAIEQPVVEAGAAARAVDAAIGRNAARPAVHGRPRGAGAAGLRGPSVLVGDLPLPILIARPAGEETTAAPPLAP